MVEVAGKKVRGRQYPWGVVEVENPKHCDFVKIRSMLITHMQDLQEVTHDVHYENYRSQKLASKGSAASAISAASVSSSTVSSSEDSSQSDKDRSLREKEAELKRM